MTTSKQSFDEILSCDVTSSNATISVYCSYSAASAMRVSGFTAVIQDTRNMEELIVGQVIGASGISFDKLEAGRYVVTVLPELASLLSPASNSSTALASAVVLSEVVTVSKEPPIAGTAIQQPKSSSTGPKLKEYSAAK